MWLIMNLNKLIFMSVIMAPALYSMDPHDQNQGDGADQGEPVHLWKQPNTPEQQAMKEALGCRRYSKVRTADQQRRNLYSLDQSTDSQSHSQMPSSQSATEQPANPKNKKEISEILATYFSFKH